MTRVIFMGTPEFAVPSLEGLVETGYEVVGVVTQPDKEAGRGRQLVPPPVKRFALAHGLPVLQPPTLRPPEAIESLRALQPEVIVVAAYGKILRPAVLSIPPRGCLNVHPSLLPRHRGASPIVGTILAGDEVGGVTLMLMDEGMDTGPVLAQRRLPLHPEETAASLEAKLAHLGAHLLVETLPRWLRGEVQPQPQDHSQATTTRLIAKEDGLIDWQLPATDLGRRVRAYHPWPGAYTTWQGKLLKILQARPLPQWLVLSEAEGSGEGQLGQVVTTPEGIAVVTGQGALLLQQVQLEGKRAMSVEEFVRGQRGFVGAMLGGTAGPRS